MRQQLSSMPSKIIPFILLVFLSFEFPSFNAQTWIKAGYWYSAADLRIEDINSALFTHLLCAFSAPNPFTNQLFINPSNEQRFSTFTNIVKHKNPSITTLLAIWATRENSSIFFSMISQASNRKSFIQSSIKTARLYGFHGLELCGVSPSNTFDMTNLGNLFNEWRTAIDFESKNSSQAPLLLTMAAHYTPIMGSMTYPVHLMQINLDWVHVVAFNYYFSSRENFTRAHAALYDPTSQINTNFGIEKWMEKGLLASKLVLGLAYHGYAWTLVNPNDNFIGAPASGRGVTRNGYMGYMLIKAYIRLYGDGAATMYNSTYVANYFTIGSTWIGFDDVEAVKTKISYAKEKRMLGYCVWHLANDDSWVLSRAARGEDKDQRNIGRLLVIILLPIFIAILLLGSMMCYFRRRWLKSRVTGKNSLAKRGTESSASENINRNAPNLQVYHFDIIEAATNSFSSENKLGEGGYGPVYKGKLPEGQEIAVKRLSKTSNQGLEEFKNEVTLTAKLQHVNLVRVLGFCVERKEKMLIYEYMPNKSLDFYLFVPIRNHLLDWNRRIHIIEGVTQGLLYLQEYSNLTVIHRDLKASNILLDNEMNPKISDFGMARTFSKDEHEANTSRIVGTYGYVPPEYVRKGVYSTKYDVYSFGVLLLQIISGKKNTCLYGSNENLNLLEYAYELWKDGRGMEFIDPSLDDSSSPCKLMRCMQIALLCVQEDPVDRPTMLEVSSMLKNGIADITTPKKPAFSVRRDEDEEIVPILREENCSVNDTTISQMLPR